MHDPVGVRMKIQLISYQRIVGRTLTKGTLISFFLVCFACDMLKNRCFKSPQLLI